MKGQALLRLPNRRDTFFEAAVVTAGADQN